MRVAHFKFTSEWVDGEESTFNLNIQASRLEGDSGGQWVGGQEKFQKPKKKETG